MTKSALPPLSALLLAAFSANAPAAGLQYWQQNASGLGVAYAGSAAVGDDASTVYFNPAAMTRLPGIQVSLGATGAWPSYRYSNAGVGIDGGDAGLSQWSGNGYATWQALPDLSLGIGISQPFGLGSDYDANWAGAPQALRSEIRTVNYNPSLAYRVSEKISLGIGANYQTFDTDLTRTGSSYSGSDGAWGWNAGALFTLSPAMRVGVSYRSATSFSPDGGSGVKLPDMAIVSVWQQVSDRWEAMGDISYTHWSATRSLGAPGESTNFDNAWRVAWGAAYRATDSWKLKFGIAYDRSPTRSSNERIAPMPDADNLWLSLGAQWNAGRWGRIDAGYSYIFVRNSNIDSTGNGIRLQGNYDINNQLLGAQYSIGF
jgi:long-chain fatty acid transport protein